MSLADERIAAMRVTVTPTDAIAIDVRAGLDGHADTNGLAHLDVEATSAAGEQASLGVRVRARQRASARDADRRARRAGRTGGVGRGRASDARRAVAWAAGRGVSLEKVVAVATSCDDADPRTAAARRLADLRDADFDALLARSADAWACDWARSDIRHRGRRRGAARDPFRDLPAADRGAAQRRAGEHPGQDAVGLRLPGHVFWDTETFMLPFFIHAHPRSRGGCLSYRFHRLDGARRKAAAGGFEGAQFPWESAGTGDEVTPTWMPDMDDRRASSGSGPATSRSMSRRSSRTRSMGYWAATGDDAFMLDRGAELVIETARFWASRAEWNADSAATSSAT